MTNKALTLTIVLLAAIAGVAQQPLSVGFAPFAAPLNAIPGATPENFRSLDSNMAEGALIDLYRAIAQSAGLTIQFKAFPAGELPQAFEDGRIDLRVIDDSAESRKTMALTDPLYRDAEVMLARVEDGQAYRSYEDFKDQVVGTRTGTASEDDVKRAGLRTASFVTVPELYAAVESGAVRVAINTTYVATAFALRDGRYPHVRIVDSYRPRFARINAIAAKKSQAPLIEKINRVLKDLKANGALFRMFARYGIERALV